MMETPNQLMQQKLLCDHIMARAAELMGTQAKASGEMVIDRILTFGVMQMIANLGNEDTAKMLRVVAGKIEDGEFDQFKDTKGNA